MKERAILLIILIISLLNTAGYGQDLPSAEILTADAAWCELSDNLTLAEILITGEVDTSRFDLVVAIQGTRDTLVNLPSGIFQLYLNNQLGRNEYIIFKVIEYQEWDILENDVYDTLIMEVYPMPEMTFTAEFESQCSPAEIVFRAKEGYPSYTWDFGEGTKTSSSTNWIRHTYPEKREAPWEEKWDADWGYVAEKYPVFLTEVGFALPDEAGAHIPVNGDETYGKALVEYTRDLGVSWVVWCFDPDWPPYMFTDWEYTPTRQGKFFKKVMSE